MTALFMILLYTLDGRGRGRGGGGGGGGGGVATRKLPDKDISKL